MAQDLGLMVADIDARMSARELMDWEVYYEMEAAMARLQTGQVPLEPHLAYQAVYGTPGPPLKRKAPKGKG